MKKVLATLLVVVLVVTAIAMIACDQKKSEVQKIIEQAQSMTMEELGRKAIEESNGKTFRGIGNSSRGKTAGPAFVKYLQTLDSTYNVTFDWQQPKNNTIFEALETDSKKPAGEFAVTLIQDGNQIESKMVQTGILDRFIPKAWADANKTTASEYKGYLALQTLNKVFMFNNTGSKTFTNVWDFVAEGEHGLFMDVDSEVVGKNFLYMLTQKDYADDLKAAYDAMPAGAAKTRIQTTADALTNDAKTLKLQGENGKYALAWIKLWVESYNKETDDGPICNQLVSSSATDKFGLLVYSKLRSVEESGSVSKNNITVAAYQDGYTGFGGYGYCHYMFVTDNSPLPWTACAFIAYITCTQDGFEAWGKDIGGYSSNPEVAKANDEKHHHSTGGMDTDGTTVLFAALNDKGYDWWEQKLIIEDPEYCASVAFTVGPWIDKLTKYNK